MDLGDGLSDSIEFLATVRRLLLWTSLQSVFIDLQPLRSISDATAVLLAAELELCAKFGAKKEIRGSYPDPDTDAYKVVFGLGVFDLLGIKGPELREEEHKWFKIHSHSYTKGPLIFSLHEHFRPVLARLISVDPSWRQRFYRALTDATTNTLDHAYPKQELRGTPYMPRRWWMAGLTHSGTETLRFVFWDQGVGIPNTIRRKGALAGLIDKYRSDAALIEHATHQGKSRIRNGRRGHGLWALVELIELAPGGTLDIISGKGRFRYRKGGASERINLASNVSGTLIVWTIRRPTG